MFGMGQGMRFDGVRGGLLSAFGTGTWFGG